jgi:hypothetical protein
MMRGLLVLAISFERATMRAYEEATSDIGGSEWVGARNVRAAIALSPVPISLPDAIRNAQECERISGRSASFVLYLFSH